MTHLPDIPVALALSLALKFMLLIMCPVLQFTTGFVDDFLGRSRVGIEAAGINTPLVSI